MKTKEELKASIEQHLKEIRGAQAEIYKLSVEGVDREAVRQEQVEARKAARVEKYKTDNGLTIYNLRMAGNEVKVTHIRYTDITIPKLDHEGNELGSITVTVPVPSYMRSVYNFNAKGGTTHIVITTPEGERHVCTAICHEVDSYDYKLGVKLALDQVPDELAKELLTSRQLTLE